MEDQTHDDQARDARRQDDDATRLVPGLRLLSPLPAETEAVVRRVMDCAFTVHRSLGPGFREMIYVRALCLELDAQKLTFGLKRTSTCAIGNGRSQGRQWICSWSRQCS